MNVPSKCPKCGAAPGASIPTRIYVREAERWSGNNFLLVGYECGCVWAAHLDEWVVDKTVECLERHIAALVGQLKKAEEERDNLTDELADLQCDIASAFGWGLEGEKFVDAIRRTIAENAVLKKRIKAN